MCGGVGIGEFIADLLGTPPVLLSPRSRAVIKSVSPPKGYQFWDRLGNKGDFCSLLHGDLQGDISECVTKCVLLHSCNQLSQTSACN